MEQPPRAIHALALIDPPQQPSSNPRLSLSKRFFAILPIIDIAMASAEGAMKHATWGTPKAFRGV